MKLTSHVAPLMVALALAAPARAQTVEEFAVTAGVEDHQSEAAVAYVAGLDSFLLLWADERVAPLIDVLGNVFAPGAEGLGEITVSNQGSDQNIPSVAFDAATGVALSVFRDSRAYPYDIYGQWLLATGGVATSIVDPAANLPVDTSGGLQDNPRVAFGGDVFVVVLADQENDADLSNTCGPAEGSCGDIVAQVFAADALAPTATYVVSDAAGFQRTPDVAYDPDAAGFLVVWADERNDADDDGACGAEEGTCIEVFARLLDAAGSPTGGEIAVSVAAFDQRRPVVAALPGAGALVVWEDSRDLDSTGWDLYAQRVAGDGSLDGGEIALAVADGTQRAPAVAACADDDRWFVAFQDNRTSAVFSVWAQVVDSDGSAYGTNFGVSSSDGSQEQVAVASGGGVVAVAWTDWRNAGDLGPDGISGTADDPVSDLYGAFVTVTSPPDNPPRAPENLAPEDGALDQPLEPTLEASAFFDIDGDAHETSRWEVCADDACDDVVYDSGDVEDLESHAVSAGALELTATYWWRVRYTDAAGRTSAPSEPTTFATVSNRAPATPENLSPADGDTDVSIRPTLEATEFDDPDGDAIASSEWQVCSDASCTNLVLAALDFEPPFEEYRVEAGALAPETTYLWRVRYQDQRGGVSEWSEPTSFTTRLDSAPDRPENVSPADGAEDVDVAPTLEASAFADADGDAHASTEWEVCLDSGCAYVAWASDARTDAFEGVPVPDGALLPGNLYYWRARYTDDTGRVSSFSAPTSFTTAADTTAVEVDDGCGCTLGAGRGAGGGRGAGAAALLLLAGLASRRRR